MFELKQGDRFVPEFYGKLKSLIDKLKMHQTTVTDASTLRRYRHNLAVSKFISGLSPSLRSLVRGYILGEDRILTLAATFSRVMRVSTEADVSPVPSIEQFAIVFGRGRDGSF